MLRAHRRGGRGICPSGRRRRRRRARGAERGGNEAEQVASGFASYAAHGQQRLDPVAVVMDERSLLQRRWGKKRAIGNTLDKIFRHFILYISIFLLEGEGSCRSCSKSNSNSLVNEFGIHLILAASNSLANQLSKK
jgi:hypothetical protein